MAVLPDPALLDTSERRVGTRLGLVFGVIAQIEMKVWYGKGMRLLKVVSSEKTRV